MDAIKKYQETNQKLEQAIKRGRKLSKLLAKLFKAAIDLKIESHNGKAFIVNGEAEVIWVKYNAFDIESYTETILGDIFLFTNQLELFSKNPYKYVPEEVIPNNVYVFGMFEDFVLDVAPHIIELFNHGVPSVMYFCWNGEKYAPIEAVHFIFNLIKIVSEPVSFRDYKASIKVNGVYYIRDLAHIKGLKKLAKAI